MGATKRREWTNGQDTASRAPFECAKESYFAVLDKDTKTFAHHYQIDNHGTAGTGGRRTTNESKSYFLSTICCSNCYEILAS